MSDQITINITPDQNVSINPITLNQGIVNHSVTHQLGGSDELLHNLLGGLQGGSGNQYYHLSSGQYFNLTTGNVVRPNETGNFITNSQTGEFYSSNNPSGFITGIDNIVFTTGNQIISGEKTFTGSFNVSTHDQIIIKSTGYAHGVEIGGFYFNKIADGGFINDFGVGGVENHFGDLAGSSNSFGGNATQNDFGSYATLNNYYGGSGIGHFDFDTRPTVSGTGVLLEGEIPDTGYLSGYVNKNETGAFYPNSNPSGFITGINNLVFTTGNQTISGIKTFISRPLVNTTGILLSGEATTELYVTGISGSLQTQITNLNIQTGSYYPRTNPSGYITGVDLSFSGNYYTKTESESRYVKNTGTETILGNKTFSNDVYINRLFVTGSESIVNTTNINVQSNYLMLNLTGGAVDGGIFFVTGSGLTGVNDSGAIIGFDHSDKFKFGIGTRASDLSVLNTIASFGDVTGASGRLQTQISTLNNQTGSYVLNTQTGNFITNSQTGQFYPNSNPLGFITGVDLSSYATQDYVTGISGGLQNQINSLTENSNNIIGLSIFL